MLSHCLASRRSIGLALDEQETPDVGSGGLVDIRARRHFALASNLAEPKIVQLALEGCKLGVSKVLVEDFPFESLRIMNLNTAVDPFNDFSVIIGEHLDELIKKLGNRMMLAPPFGFREVG